MPIEEGMQKFGIRTLFDVKSADQFETLMSHIAEMFRRTETTNDLEWDTLRIHTDDEGGIKFGIFGRGKEEGL